MKYKIGDKVLFRGRIGYVIDIVSSNRYYLKSAGWVWSVTDDQIHQPNRFKGLNPV